ncbi:MAG: NADH-quinone oxidoreductase subunit NuoH [Ardenticatenaceae bacterium]|nr:NADH-quinone oxidoreductase subunit NuoH [Ardenticatenaceae bacterium]
MAFLDRLFIEIGHAWTTFLLRFLPEGVVSLIGILLSAILISTFAALTFLVMTFLERKVVARIQDRIGPNRAGPFGVLQPFADMLKMFTKELTTPAGAHKIVFNLAPIIAAAPGLMIFAVIPFGKGMVAADLDVGVIYFIAIGSIAEIGILMGGWASRNKFALLGAMRAVAQMISYEIPMVLAFMGILMMAGTLKLSALVEAQVLPFLVLQPVAFLIWLVSAAAELNRSPFDIMEAESEIVAGYHTEYSGMKFGLFQMAEFVAAYASAAIATTVFFGGWRGIDLPGVDIIPGWLIFWLKSYIIVFALFWFRGTFPRLRIDQLQAFCWKFLVPAALLNVLVTGVVVYFFPIMRVGVQVPAGAGWVVTTAAYLIGNAITIVLLLIFYRRPTRRAAAQFQAVEPTPAVIREVRPA